MPLLYGISLDFTWAVDIPSNMNDNNKPPKVLDTYTRQIPSEKNVGKLAWFSYRGKIFIGKVYDTTFMGYVMECYHSDSGFILHLFANAQEVIFPE